MRLLLALLLLSGCATTSSVDWSPGQFTRIDLPALDAPVATAPATEPAPGRVELDEPVVAYLLDVEGNYGPCRGALSICYRERSADVEEARAIMLALEEQRALARRGQVRAFAVGAGAGAAAVVAVVLAVALARP